MTRIRNGATYTPPPTRTARTGASASAKAPKSKPSGPTGTLTLGDWTIKPKLVGSTDGSKDGTPAANQGRDVREAKRLQNMFVDPRPQPKAPNLLDAFKPKDPYPNKTTSDLKRELTTFRNMLNAGRRK